MSSHGDDFDIYDPINRQSIAKTFIQMLKKCDEHGKRGVVIVPAKVHLLKNLADLTSVVSKISNNPEVTRIIDNEIDVIVFSTVNDIPTAKKELKKTLKQYPAKEFMVFGAIPDELTEVIVNHFATGE